MENVIKTAPAVVVPTLYKAAAVSVIALSIAGIGALTGYLPAKKSDVAQAALVAPAPAVAPLPQALAAPLAQPAAQAPASVPAVSEPAPKPRVIRTTTKRNYDVRYEPRVVASPVSTHPVEVSASGTGPVAYPASQGYPAYPSGSQNAQTTPQSYPTVPAPVVAQAPVRQTCTSCGTIEAIREIEKPGEGSGLGMAGGALGGAVVGKQFGNGRGRDALTILGAIGGGFAGHQVEKNMRTVKSYEVQVRMEDGSLRSIPSPTQPSWRPGERVKVDGGTISINYS